MAELLSLPCFEPYLALIFGLMLISAPGDRLNACPDYSFGQALGAGVAFVLVMYLNCWFPLM